MSATVRLTVAQAIVRFLAAQYSERAGDRHRLIVGVLGIFGHGNVAGLGQALLQHELAAVSAGRTPELPYVLTRNEQAQVHTAVGFARQRRRLQAWACTASVGPGSTNMITGAALATINRIPVLLLPSSVFATRATAPVLQELERFSDGTVTANEAFRPVSLYFDEIIRPEQLPSALLAAMRVLTDPADTGAVTISLPQDVQAQAHDWPAELFAERTWHIRRPPAEPDRIAAAAAVIRSARRPFVVAGGGVHYSAAEHALADFCAATGIPVGETQAGKGSLLHGDPRLMGAVGSTGSTAANALARSADVVIGVGTRYSDFTTASRTAFQADGVRFVNINITGFDAGKHAGLSIVADAGEALRQLASALGGDEPYRVSLDFADEAARQWKRWDDAVATAYSPGPGVTDGLADGVLTQGQVLGAVNELADPRDVVLCAAGSMPGDIHKLWRVRDHDAYHVEYGYSCMGYEIPASIGVRWADPSRDVFAMVGDGGYLMMPSEIVTAVAERVKVIVVLVVNDGFGSIGALSESLGSQRFGTRYRFRDGVGRLAGPALPVDLAANARSLGATVLTPRTVAELHAAIATAKAAPADGGPVVICVHTDPLVAGSPDSESWWDVPVSQVSALDSTQAAYASYVESRKAQRDLIAPTDGPTAR